MTVWCLSNEEFHELSFNIARTLAQVTPHHRQTTPTHHTHQFAKCTSLNISTVLYTTWGCTIDHMGRTGYKAPETTLTWHILAAMRFCQQRFPQSCRRITLNTPKTLYVHKLKQLTWWTPPPPPPPPPLKKFPGRRGIKQGGKCANPLPRWSSWIIHELMLIRVQTIQHLESHSRC